MISDPVVRVDNLVYRYREGESEREVLSSVSFSLQPGERVALVGDSGCGKSTLLNLIGTIDSPDAGSIRIACTEVVGLPEPARTLFRRAQLGFVYQRFNLLPMLTVAENIALPMELLGVAAAVARERVAHWLQAVGLAARRDSFPDRLSGGEQQRVAIARALVHGPRLLLADEPTGSLDPRIAETVLDLLFDCGADGERALLLVTHSEAVAQRADRILRLDAGLLHDGGADC